MEPPCVFVEPTHVDGAVTPPTYRAQNRFKN